MNRFTLFAFVAFFTHLSMQCGGSSRVEYYASAYTITDKNDKAFLEQIVKSKDADSFFKSHKKTIESASPKLLDAAYWLANEQGKLDLANRLLMILESKK